MILVFLYNHIQALAMTKVFINVDTVEVFSS